MKVSQFKWTGDQWESHNQDPFTLMPQLVLVFGGRDLLSYPDYFIKLRKLFPLSHIISCSTASEIIGTRVMEDTITATAVQFEKTTVKVAHTTVSRQLNSYTAGNYLSEILRADDLVHLFVISDGQIVNGSELVDGLNDNNFRHVPITGGLAGDGSRFQKTLVGLNDPPTPGKVIAVGFYGNNLKVGHGSKGGWDSFGPERMITKSNLNELLELDNQNALELYKKYLGPLADQLPSSALLFPLSICLPGSDETLVRTVLAVNEKSQSMTFAGNVPEGAKARLMKANFERLIDASAYAANNSLASLDSFKPELAVLISCVGRKLVLSHRAEEEVEEARKVLGEKTAITGFYSYGEISPLVSSHACQLHNQTMTITTYCEF